MNKETIEAFAAELYETLPGNILSPEMDIRPEYVGIPMFDAPVIGVAAASDPLYEEYKKVGVIGPWHMSPAEWLPEAKSVISFFFPASRRVKESNRKETETGSTLWAYARVDGENYIISYMENIAAWLRENGCRACIPSLDPRWREVRNGKGIDGYPEMREDTFGSRWSERHTAYACGLGTFGLSKGLITKKGMAGRLSSVLIDAPLEPDPRPYTGIYDYCTKCGACIRRCPVGAIDMEKGKDHVKCGQCLGKSGKIHYPRYGCGLCQTGVPCESGIPGR